MFYTFVTTGIIITFFTTFKLWEEKRQKNTWLTEFFLAQDDRVERIILRFVSSITFVERQLKFFFSIKIPFYFHVVLRKILLKVSAQFKKGKDYIRGKYIAHPHSITSSEYFAKIASFKKSLHTKQRTEKKEE